MPSSGDLKSLPLEATMIRAFRGSNTTGTMMLRPPYSDRALCVHAGQQPNERDDKPIRVSWLQIGRKALVPIAALVMVMSSFTSASASQTEPEKQWVWLADQGVWGFGYQLQDGPHRGLWRIDPDSKRPPACDPYGFLHVLNRYRAAHGLPAVNYDPDLSSWASLNNAAQCRHGIGHHVTPNCNQNAGYNYTNAEEVAAGWMNSPGHRANMLTADISRLGIAYGPGPYWTMNVR
jgi:hypothetical protein